MPGLFEFSGQVISAVGGVIFKRVKGYYLIRRENKNGPLVWDGMFHVISGESLESWPVNNPTAILVMDIGRRGEAHALRSHADPTKREKLFQGVGEVPH